MCSNQIWKWFFENYSGFYETFYIKKTPFCLLFVYGVSQKRVSGHFILALTVNKQIRSRFESDVNIVLVTMLLP